MRAFKCDICGKLYERNNFLIVEDVTIDNISFAQFKVKLGDDHHYCDVCPECISKIQSVIDEAQREKNEKEKK